MTLVEISGGLGNQLFQYAMARRLALRGDGIMHADLYQLGLPQNQPPRKFRLDLFHSCVQPLPWHCVWRYSKREFLDRLTRRYLPKKLARRLLSLAARRGLKSPCAYRFDACVSGRPKPMLQIGMVVSERQFHFDPEVLDLSGDLLLMGYWQTEKYFADIAPQLRAELQVKTPQTGQNLAVGCQMRAQQSVSLHIRRGDKAVAKDFNGSTAEYHQRAMAWFRERLSNPVFFVFTDDWDWVQQHLPAAPDVIHVNHNSQDQEYEDLRLMSQCRHHIIALSSFSWWGAWLNPSPDKLVVCPPHKRWFNFPNCDTVDIFPDTWVQIDDL
ncbi:alpha-1,2-fucosyltransferase [Prosthecobacter vanneervenii]|uniref:Glycosyl transferase family 11 n=1 Tax=Prosthecobacter vanneervenii TaxID=48466 RepID=A0A7W8DHZ0_9BACT|nr:alpha-1,2-fucosyltransferase [Prosthecobacter vanneervenii]MBB5030467.1 hypothetical protein [Prosthecobacter vanneervenii]